MIHIEQGQKIPENENLRVSSPTGDYDDNALIEFYDVVNPNIVVGAFAAQFVKYGSIVYKYSSPRELGEALLLVDKESTHASASYIRMNKELERKMNEGSLEIDSLDEIISDQKQSVEDKRQEQEIDESENEELTPVEESAPVPETEENSGEILGFLSRKKTSKKIAKINSTKKNIKTLKKRSIWS